MVRHRDGKGRCRWLWATGLWTAGLGVTELFRMFRLMYDGIIG